MAFNGFGNLIMDGFSRCTGNRILDAANLVNQLETKLYPHSGVDKSNSASFKNEGFYYFSRRLPIIITGSITEK